MKILMILFILGLLMLVWLWHNKPALRRAEADPSGPTPSPLDGRPGLDLPMQRNTEHAFLQLLIGQDASDESCLLQARLGRAECHEKFLHRVLLLMGLLFMLSLTGLCYCAILLPEVFLNPANLVTRSLCYLGIGSLVSWVGFLGDFLWHRTAVSRLHRECRHQVLVLARPQLEIASSPGLTLHTDAQPPLQSREDDSSFTGPVVDRGMRSA